MKDRSPELTLEELRARIEAARVPIPEARLEMVRALLNVGLKPIRAMDPSAMKTIEPAVTFDAAQGGGAAPTRDTALAGDAARTGDDDGRR
jgi:hypothetical protein